MNTNHLNTFHADKRRKIEGYYHTKGDNMVVLELMSKVKRDPQHLDDKNDVQPKWTTWLLKGNIKANRDMLKMLERSLGEKNVNMLLEALQIWARQTREVQFNRKFFCDIVTYLWPEGLLVIVTGMRCYIHHQIMESVLRQLCVMAVSELSTKTMMLKVLTMGMTGEWVREHHPILCLVTDQHMFALMCDYYEAQSWAYPNTLYTTVLTEANVDVLMFCVRRFEILQMGFVKCVELGNQDSNLERSKTKIDFLIHIYHSQKSANKSVDGLVRIK